jgi:hypothetical protein
VVDDQPAQQCVGVPGVSEVPGAVELMLGWRGGDRLTVTADAG